MLVSGNSRPNPDDPLASRYTITAVNLAVRPVEIGRVGVICGNGVGSWYGPPPANLPARLEDGQSVTVEISPDWIELVRDSLQQEIVGFAAEDSLGWRYPSEAAPAVTAMTEMGFIG